MAILSTLRQHSWTLAAGWMIAGSVGLGMAQAQVSQAEIQRIESLRTQIKTAEGQHVNAAEVGKLWLQLANEYYDQLEFAQAEDAFARSLRLLRTPETQAQYADAHDGMGSLYLDTGRTTEAIDWSKKALAIYQALGERTLAGKMHETIALAALFARRYREAESESAAGLTELHAAGDTDQREMVAAYLTHSYALCYLKQCSAALDDATHALVVARAKFPADSMEVVSGLLTQAYAEWKMGALDESDRAMTDALRLARGLKDLPRPILIGTQLGVMRQYDAFLKATHRKPEAAQMEAEMQQLQSKQPTGCNGCTVGVAALGFLP